MEYFQLKQDKRYLHTPIISNIKDIIQRRAVASGTHALKLPDVSVGFSQSVSQLDYVDVLDTQFYMVSDKVKKVFQLYKPEMIFKAVCILNNTTGDYGNYNIPIFREIDCLGDASIISPDKSFVKKLAIKEEVLENLSIFKVKGLLTDVIIIRLDVAESLLRRNITRLTLERVEVEESKKMWRTDGR